MPGWILLPLAIAGVLAIFLTTPLGHRMAAALGIRAQLPGDVPLEDRDFLLRVCGDDAREVERRLAVERARNDSLSIKQQYRKAIRTYLNEQRSAGSTLA
jgi:uncharacterized protein (DUF934 family)